MFPARYFAGRYWAPWYWSRGTVAQRSHLSTQALLSMRRSMGLAMPDLVTVRRRTLTLDSQGGYVETWSTQAVRRGRLFARSRTGPEGEVDGRGTSVTQWGLLCEYGADLLPRDRILVGGVEYEVTVVTTGTEYLAVEADLRNLA